MSPKKPRNEEMEEVSNDKFSSLPNTLLSTIVSSLPFKEAVRTSILAKSWLNICKATANIEFNELFFVKFDQPREVREAQRRTFINFTTSWIENHRETLVEKFSLRLTMPQNEGELIERCAEFATKYGTKELELDFTYPSWDNDDFYYDVYEASCELPRQVYGLSCVQILRLFSCSFVGSECVNFHALKEVSLGWMKVRFVDIKALLLNCKVLESLILKKCWNSEDFDLEEENKSLRKLVVDKCHFRFNTFRVNAPKLRFFGYCGLMTFLGIDIRTPVLEEANLDFSREYGFQGHGPFLYKLVHDLSAARVLTVCSYFLQVSTFHRSSLFFSSMIFFGYPSNTSLFLSCHPSITFYRLSFFYCSYISLGVGNIWWYKNRFSYIFTKY